MFPRASDVVVREAARGGDEHVAHLLQRRVRLGHFGFKHQPQAIDAQNIRDIRAKLVQERFEIVLFEDAHLIVVDKPAGMATHPAPGSESGTLVNALLHHCGDSLSGIGGVARPGIVHRLDKGTSGVMVAAKHDRAHQGLTGLFAAHDIERTYIALTRGTLTPERGRIESRLGRSTNDRKKMAVLRVGGREAITDYVVERTFGLPAKAGGAPLAARVACTLHTGRTHQIRVHMASKGAPLLGDPVYGSGPPAGSVRDAIAAAALTRQALHAAILGFVHPITDEPMRFETSPPGDMRDLQSRLEAL